MTASPAASPRPLGQRVAELAERHPERPAIILVDARSGTVDQIDWAGLERHSARLAGRLAPAADAPAAWMAITNTLPDLVTLIGALRARLTVAVVNAAAPESERARAVEAVRADFGAAVPLAEVLDGPPMPAAGSERPGSDEPPGGGWILLTGGSTGVPKPIRAPEPPHWHPERGVPLLLRRTGWRPGQVQLVLGSMHHAAPFTGFIDGVLSGNTVVLVNGYYPELFFELVEQFGIEWAQLAPVHMIMAEPLLEGRSLPTLRAILHTSAPCPARTKRAWIRALGPGRVFEMYAATEGIGQTLCDGTEWLARPGTVGRGFLSRIRIADTQGRELPVGEVGEVWMRGLGRGAGPGTIRRAGGFRSVHDHGYVDPDGYLYLCGRADDVVIIGGENVYLGEVEAALLRHTEVADAAVRGVQDEVYGVRLAADVVPRPGSALDVSALERHCREQLPEYKRPRILRLVSGLPRNQAGKLLRALLTPLTDADLENRT